MARTNYGVCRRFPTWLHACAPQITVGSPTGASHQAKCAVLLQISDCGLRSAILRHLRQNKKVTLAARLPYSMFDYGPSLALVGAAAIHRRIAALVGRRLRLR